MDGDSDLFAGDVAVFPLDRQCHSLGAEFAASVRRAILAPAELEKLGFRIVIYGISPLMHAVRAIENVLSSLAQGKTDFAGNGVGFEDYKSIVEFDRWAAIETLYQPKD